MISTQTRAAPLPARRSARRDEGREVHGEKRSGKPRQSGPRAAFRQYGSRGGAKQRRSCRPNLRRLSAARRSFGITAQTVHTGGNVLEYCCQAGICQI